MTSYEHNNIRYFSQYCSYRLISCSPFRVPYLPHPLANIYENSFAWLSSSQFTCQRHFTSHISTGANILSRNCLWCTQKVEQVMTKEKSMWKFRVHQIINNSDNLKNCFDDFFLLLNGSLDILVIRTRSLPSLSFLRSLFFLNKYGDKNRFIFFFLNIFRNFSPQIDNYFCHECVEMVNGEMNQSNDIMMYIYFK